AYPSPHRLESTAGSCGLQRHQLLTGMHTDAVHKIHEQRIDPSDVTTMCGIIGIVGYDVSEERLRRPVAFLHHRGPDAEGLYLDAEHRLGLAHARLAIIDRQTGNQPLKDASG